jgi:Cupin domain
MNRADANPPKVLLRSEDSGGHVAIVELRGGGRPPLHHHDFDEAFYLLEGELTFQLGDDVFTRRAGELAWFERYFDRIAARVTGTEPPPEAAKPIPEVITVGRPLGPESIPSVEDPGGVDDEGPVRNSRSRRAEVEEGE